MASDGPAFGPTAISSLIGEETPSAQHETQWHADDLQPLDTLDHFELPKPSMHMNAERPQKSKKTKRKDESLSGLLRAALVEHQLGLSINCLLLLALTHIIFPTLRLRTSQFFYLSYYEPQTGRYATGWDDLKSVSFWIVVFTALRAGFMDYILVPYARWVGISKKKATIRFAEQAWLLIYYAVFWSLGMYLMYKSPYFFNLPAMWADFPTHRSMSGTFKWYYLAQLAFWLQQIVVVHVEERRKDHWQMFTHHIITCALILASYGCYHTKVGNVILCLMDVVDLIFPVAKMLRYGGYQTACDIAFGVFIVTWFVARHLFYMAVCWSVYVDSPAAYGCFNPNTGEAATSDAGGVDIWSNVIHAYQDTDAPVCYNRPLMLTFLALLLALQVLTLIWFGMICRVAYGVLSGKGAEDSRSDDEDEEDECEEETEQRDWMAESKPHEAEVQMRLQAREEEVGVEELTFAPHRRSSPKKSARKSKSRASGISLPGHGDHKDLLGRIGCDKPT